MSIVIQKVDSSLYLANVTPPHSTENRACGPLTVRELIVELFRLGCHQTDIGDAFYQADPHWLDPY